ncbi:MAG: phosphatase PAP2 family protein [Bacteroidia bacterium]|nr:phosphatase PAP2 family protein [Bacteroidia bacterium]
MNRLNIKHWFGFWSAAFLRVHQHPIFTKYRQRYPRLFRFISLRFDPHRFRGLPLTMFLLGLVLNAFILSEMAEELREASRLRNVDRLLAQYFYVNRHEGLAQFIYRFTRLGSSPTVLTVLAALGFLLLRRNRFHAFAAIVASLCTSSLSAYAGKVYYQVPRPHELAWYEEFSYSFPSGHATVAMAYYGILFYLLVMYMKDKRFKIGISLLAALFIFAMGFSRVYLGVHYLSDVLSGFAIGFVWLLFSIALLSWLDFRRELRS